MDYEKLLREIDAEIARLQQARALLQQGEKPRVTAKSAPVARSRKSRVLSPEARKRIANAQKKRWATRGRDGGYGNGGGGTGDGGYGLSGEGRR